MNFVNEKSSKDNVQSIENYDWNIGIYYKSLVKNNETEDIPLKKDIE